MTLADRIVVMRDGEIEQIGSPMEIYSDPVNDFVADFFGSPSMNLIAGEIVQAIAHCGSARRASISRCRRGSIPQSRAAPRSASAPSTSACGSARTATAALPVRLVEPLGKDTLLYFDDGTPRAFIAVSEGLAMAEVSPGAKVALSFDPERLYLFGEDGRRVR